MREEFILDRALTPALDEFGLEAVRLIDPTCGSGHFLLGAFDRLYPLWEKRWQQTGDSRDTVASHLVQRVLDQIHGVDLNPFAVAIARFRLMVAAVARKVDPPPHGHTFYETSRRKARKQP